MNISTAQLSRRAFLGGSTALAAFGVLTLAGCATPAAPGAGTGAGANAATEAKTINFYGNSLGEEALKPAWQAILDNFSKANDVTVAPVVYPYDQAATQLALTGRSGNLMGVGQSGGWQVLTPMNILADLTDLAEDLEIPQGVLDAYTMDGKLLVLPLTAAGIGIITNGEIAKSVGIKSGMTVEEFATALEKIKTQDPSLIPYAAVTKNPDLKDAAHWMWGFGSEVVTDDFECTIGDEESVEAITWYKSLQDAGLTQTNVARSDARILFASGRAALYDDAPLASTFVVTNGAAQNIIDNIGAIARPTANGNESYNRAWGGGLFATAGEGEVTSREFILYALTDVKSATDLYERSAVAPASKKVADQIPALAADKFQTAFRTEVSEHARGAAWDRVAVTAQIDTAIGAGVANILAGQGDVQSGLNSLKKEVQDLLDANS
ncbi:ABC transporter substrate-binding protein [Microbacterium murale]|uniref:ABC-type glycerol-3-phosphate transport system substrate-binding protein n=1 Tax=Microbacterium murale TaxID=1081040 RepID=A0ABU0P783_9MICO|nr:extracellular solute-binding protein [Microbacterium murale]MDQ0643188.1 ABC-type glycerol-3-phosphate transport system substrate-binding protein [Microbacterium murale]